MVLMTMSGNVSKCGADVVVGTLFNKQPRKFRKRPLCKHKRKVAMTDLTGWVDIYFLIITLVIFRCFVLGLSKKCMMVLSTIIDNWVASHYVPERVAILARDIVAYKCRSPRVIVSNVNGN